MKRLGTVLGFIFGSLGLLITFTVIKFPENRVRELIQGKINSALQPSGIVMTVKESNLSVGLGPQYKMTGIQLISADWPSPMTIDEVVIRPSLLGLLTGKTGAHATLRQGSGQINADISLRGQDYSLRFQIEKLSLSRMTPVAHMAGVAISGTVGGSGDLKGNTENLSALNGSLAVELSQVGTEEAKIQGFSIPKLAIASGTLRLDFGNGKGTIKALTLGSAVPADDIVLKVKGGLTLGRRVHNSSLNVDLDLLLSEKVKTSLSAIDLLLGQMRQPDGSYAFNLSGGLSGGVMMNPIGTERR